MGAEEVLRGTLIVVALLPAIALADTPRDRLRVPERLTAGVADQFLGALSPDGERLYFVSTANATLQIFSQSLDGGPAAPLFDEAADATLPRPSPDGRSLAYLSYRADATGDVCIRDLATLQRRCLTDADTAEQDLLWVGAGKSILAVARPGLHDDVELDRIAADNGSRQALLFRGIASPALSPDERWLAYIPTERESEVVGPSFASRATRAIALQRYDQLRERPLVVAFDLAGASAFPAFSADGRWLYFAQYQDDTNLDGVIDGRDRSTLFRVPFDGRAAAPIAARDLAHPQQLTSVSWNCQYPAPGPTASDRLIATCSIAGSLDVYSLPLDGSVPPEWGADRLRQELRTTSDRGERLLYTERLLALGLPDADARELLEDELRMHLYRGGLESAAWTMQRLHASGHMSPDVLQVFDELVAQRGAERALELGRLSGPFVAETRARLQRVERLGKEGEPGAFRELLRAELLDVLGEKQAAVEAMHAIDLGKAVSPLLLELVAERGAHLYLELDLEPALLDLYRALTTHDTLDEVKRLGYAERYVTTLLRGAQRSTHAALIAGALRGAPAGGELAARLELEAALLHLGPGLDAAAMDKMRTDTFTLFQRATTLERKRMVVHVAVERARVLDPDRLVLDLARAWMQSLPKGSVERRYAVLMFRDVMMERAYAELRRGQLAEAKARFFKITQHVDSLEAWSNFLSLRAAEDPVQTSAELEARFAQAPDSPVLHYGRAFLALTAAGRLTAHDARLAEPLDAIDRALEQLKLAGRSLSRSTELNYLWGYALCARYLVTGEHALAEEADTKLLLALDLARDNPRYRATTLELLGRVQSNAGNHRIALEHLSARELLPFASPAGQLGHLLAKARSHQQIGQGPLATLTIEDGLRLVEHEPELARYRPLLLDRAALHHLAAGEATHAAQRWDELAAALPSAEISPAEAARDRYTSTLGRGAAYLADGKPREAARDLAEAASLLARKPALARPPTPRPTDLPPDRDGLRTYELLLSGMRAEAHRLLGDLDEATRQQTRRRDLLRARHAELGADEDLLALGEAEAHLGEYAAARNRLDEAALHYGAALDAAERYSQMSGTEIHPLRMSVLSDLVTLRVRARGKHRNDPSLARKIRALLGLLARQRHPDWIASAAELERDLATLDLLAGDPPR